MVAGGGRPRDYVICDMSGSVICPDFISSFAGKCCASGARETCVARRTSSPRASAPISNSMITAGSSRWSRGAHKHTTHASPSVSATRSCCSARSLLYVCACAHGAMCCLVTCVRCGTALRGHTRTGMHTTHRRTLSLPRLCSCASQLCVTATCSSYGDPPRGTRLIASDGL